MGSLKGQAHEMAVFSVYALMVHTVHPSYDAEKNTPIAHSTMSEAAF
jgi:hypothetical protein